MSNPDAVTVQLVGGPMGGTLITVPTDQHNFQLTVFTGIPESKHYTYELLRFNGTYLGIGEDLEPQKLKAVIVSLDLKAVPDTLDWIKDKQAKSLLDRGAIPETILATVTPINDGTDRVKVITTALTAVARLGPGETK